MRPVEADLDAEAVVLEQDRGRIVRIALVAEELVAVGEVGAWAMRADVDEELADLDGVGDRLRSAGSGR